MPYQPGNDHADLANGIRWGRKKLGGVPSFRQQIDVGELHTLVDV